MLSRTEFQHVSGTRVSMDFVEVPSIFTELFLKNSFIVSQFARHYKTCEPLNVEEYNERVHSSSLLDTIEIQHQISMAMLGIFLNSHVLDQVYHSETAGSMNSTQVLEQVQNSIHVLPFVKGTAWQVQFSHLFGYGAGYYSYFWSRKWASRIHHQLLHHKHLDEWKEVGETLNSEVLGLGGSRNPWYFLKI
jgi:intermediate peptidase